MFIYYVKMSTLITIIIRSTLLLSQDDKMFPDLVYKKNFQVVFFNSLLYFTSNRFTQGKNIVT